MNPADFVIKLAQAPEFCGTGLDFEKLIEYFKNYLDRPVIEKMVTDKAKYTGISTKFDKFGENRKVGPCTQFAAIF